MCVVFDFAKAKQTEQSDRQTVNPMRDPLNHLEANNTQEQVLKITNDKMKAQPRD